MTTPFTADFVDALADALADRLAQALGERKLAADVVDAATLAARLGVSAQWVRDHAGELGGWRMGDGPKAPYRFDARTAEQRLRGRTPVEPDPPTQRPPSPRREAGLLPRRGDDPT